MSENVRSIVTKRQIFYNAWSRNSTDLNVAKCKMECDAHFTIVRWLAAAIQGLYG